MSTTPAKTAATASKTGSRARATPARKTAPASQKDAGARAKPAKPAKEKKPKLVRGSYTIPKDEYAALGALKQRCAKLTRPVKKSELLRAGIKLLAGLDGAALLAALKAVPAVKTGRPKKS